MSSIQLPDTLTESAASKLRRMLSDSSRLIVAPGVYDGISARLAISLGFKAIYMVSICPPLSRLLH
jgi:methylisocitrate lyase